MKPTQAPLEVARREADAHRVIVPQEMPIFLASVGGGIDYICPSCRWVAAKNILPGQVRDVVVRCPRCSLDLRFPRVALGEPFPPASTTALLASAFRIEAPVVIPDEFTQIVGRASAERYAQQTRTILRWNVRWNPFPPPPPDFDVDPRTSLSRAATPPAMEGIGSLTPAALATLELRFRSVLGSPLSALLGETERAGNVTADPNHPACVELNAIRDAIKTLRAGVERVDHHLIVRGILDVALLERWRDHPGFRGVTESLYQGTNYRSAVAALGTATMLADCGNGVTLVPRGREPAPDLFVKTEVRRAYGCEVKSPDRFYEPTRFIGLAEGEQIVSSQIGNVLEKRQIRAALPGILALGAYGLSYEQALVIDSAAKRAISRQPSDNGLLMVAIVNIMEAVGEKSVPKGSVTLPPGTSVRPAFQLFRSPHPAHQQGVFLSVSGPGVTAVTTH